jgi:hypothetical protein
MHFRFNVWFIGLIYNEKGFTICEAFFCLEKFWLIFSQQE